MKLCPRCSESFADDAAYCPFDGAALARNPDPLVGRTLAARYRLVRPLGSGGMALVYLAKHVMIDRLSAIKILRRDLAMSASHRERFLREARAVNRINHPNIVEITDLGESDGLVFLVMEYVEGESLLRALRHGPFPWTRAARLTAQIASALARAHDVGVIHRDLKPENVLLTVRGGDDFVKLTDFGIAKILDAPALTFSEQRFGTPGYIAPEYAEGAPAGALGDLYALGVVFYEMLTGAMPFDARGIDLIVAPLREAPIKPSARLDGIPAEVEELVLRLIARQPVDRPRDAFAVVDLLGDLLRRVGGSLRPPPSPGGEEGRPSVATAVVDPPRVSSRSLLTAEIAAMPTAEIAARWHGMLAELSVHVDAAHTEHGDHSGILRARELSIHAADLVTSLERAKSTVAEHQARVDRLETHGRAFRGTLGHAIDTLSRDRSRERAHLEAITARRDGIDTEVTLTGGIDMVLREVLVWEQAALEAEDQRAILVEQDLGYQIEALQRQLAAQNEQLDTELADATGKLEGALSALRRMTGELIRTIEEAASAVER
jgi:hypothetical protein